MPANSALTKSTIHDALSTMPDAPAIEHALIAGDLSKLNVEQRLSYYKAVCDSVGLNPLTKPFDYINLNGKLVLYAKRDATEQLRKIHGVSITNLATSKYEDLYVVTATASDKSGRTDAGTGAVNLTGLKGEALANALMKAETKAKRRVTLSICGLGLLDETEVASIPGARSMSPPEGQTEQESIEEYEAQHINNIRKAEGWEHFPLAKVAETSISGKNFWVKAWQDGIVDPITFFTPIESDIHIGIGGVTPGTKLDIWGQPGKTKKLAYEIKEASFVQEPKSELEQQLEASIDYVEAKKKSEHVPF